MECFDRQAPGGTRSMGKYIYSLLYYGLFQLKNKSACTHIWVSFFQTELMVEICSKSLVRAMGEVLLIKLG